MGRKPRTVPTASRLKAARSRVPGAAKAGPGRLEPAPKGPNLPLVPTAGAGELHLGDQICTLRARRGFTQERLAAATGFTKGYLSKIEHSKVIPPIGTLIKIAQVLNADLADFFNPKRADAEHEAVSVVRKKEREPVVRGGSSFGYDYVTLAHKRRSKRMEPFVMVFPSKIDRDIRFAHDGEEFIFILAGKVEFEARIDGRDHSWILSAGDAAYFDSHLPHRGRSLRGESRALVVIYRAK